MNFSLALYYMTVGQSNHMIPAFIGWVAFTLAVIYFILWMAVLKGDLYKQLFLLGLWLSLLSFSIFGWTSQVVFDIIGGYISLVTALIAAYIAAQELWASGEVA